MMIVVEHDSYLLITVVNNDILKRYTGLAELVIIRTSWLSKGKTHANWFPSSSRRAITSGLVPEKLENQLSVRAPMVINLGHGS